MEDAIRELAVYRLDDVDDDNGRELGRGSYGVVRTVKRNGKEFAAKSFHGVLNGRLEEGKMVSNFVEECRKTVGLDHENVVRFYGLYYPSDGLGLPSIVMELLPYCLWNALETHGIPRHFKCFILADVANGLNYLHDNSILHRDLTANNVLLTWSLRAKISDFGQAKVVNLEQLYQQHSMAPGNVIYMPPEAKLDQPSYDASLDVFSFGVLILHTFLERLPQPQNQSIVDDRTNRIYDRTPLEYFHDDISVGFSQGDEDYKNLSCQCLEYSPDKRPKTLELVIITTGICRQKPNEITSRLKTYCKELEDKVLVLEKKQEDLEASLSKMIDENDQLKSMHKGPGPHLLTQVLSFDAEEDMFQSMRLLPNYADEVDAENCRLGEALSLLQEVERLKHENELLRNENISLRNKTSDPKELSMMMNSVKPASTDEVYPPPLTVYGPEGERKLLEDGHSSVLTVQDVPQEPLSFDDIKGAQAVFLKDTVYIGRTTSHIWSFDTKGLKWKKLSQESPLKNYALAAYQDQLVLIGGSTNDGKISSDVLVYQDEKWTPGVIPSLRESRENASALGVDIYLVVIGGSSIKRRTSLMFMGPAITTFNIDIYTSKDGWRECPAKLKQPFQVQPLAKDGYLYLADSRSVYYSTIRELLSNKNALKKVKREMPFSHSCICIHDKTLLAISGSSSDGSIYAYCPSKSNWNKVTYNEPHLSAVKSAQCLSVDDYKYFVCCGDATSDLLKGQQKKAHFIEFSVGGTWAPGYISVPQESYSQSMARAISIQEHKTQVYI
jgi:serine/threonine protein kinase